jgi:glycosyltransferase involved in cell wall biosynthesis
MKDIDIIIPVKNEEASVKSLVERIDAALKKHAISYQIIFVDDHSTDSTKRHIVSLSKKYNVTYHKKVGKMGKAFSILEGSKISTAKYIGMIDGDLQYPPEAIPELYQIAQKTGLAIAQRQKREEGILRTIVSKTYQTIMGKFILGTHHDMQSGLKIFNREIINHISEAEVTPWTIDVALLHTAKQLGYSIGSLPIVFEERKSGSSKIKVVKDSIEIGTQALKYRFKKAQIYEINAKKDQVMGSGIAYKGKRFITHSDLPHQNSALVTFTNPQKATILFILGIFVLGITFSPLLTITIVIAVMTAIYFADVVFSLSVLLKSLHFPPELAFTDNDIDAIKDTTLPLYSILCPLYKEAHILPEFCEAIKELDWPKNKLEVLLLLEEDDKDTIAAAKTLNLPSYFKVIVVPHSFPKTKPKACNYGLTQAKGEYVVKYEMLTIFSQSNLESKMVTVIVLTVVPH